MVCRDTVVLGAREALMIIVNADDWGSSPIETHAALACWFNLYGHFKGGSISQNSKNQPPYLAP